MREILLVNLPWMQARVAICGPKQTGKSKLMSMLKELPNRDVGDLKHQVRYIDIENPMENFDSLYHLVVITFDLTNLKSYMKALKIVGMTTHAPRLLIGVADLPNERKISRRTAIRNAKERDLFYREVCLFEVSEVTEVNSIIEDIVERQLALEGSWKIKISNKRHMQLKYACKWLSVTAMVQGLIMMSYGSLLFLMLKSYQEWIGDTQMFGGTLTFMISFLGYYGVRYSGIKEYLDVVRVILVCVASAPRRRVQARGYPVRISS